MFKLSTATTYSWPVSISVPMDGGKFKEEKFDAVFRRVPQSKIKEILAKIENGEITDNQFCKEVMSGYKGVTDEAGQEIPVSESGMDELLDFPMMAKAIVTAYLESVSGQKAKN